MTPPIEREVVFKMRGNGVYPIGHNFGVTVVAYTFGRFELWRSRATSAWNASAKCRVSTPSSFRIVKRIGRIDAIVGGKKSRAELAIVMRRVTVGLHNWAAVRTALVEQVEALGREG